MVESSLGTAAGAPAALLAVQNLSSTVMVGPTMLASPVMSTATTTAQSVISSLPTHNASAAAAESHAAVFALPMSYESGSDDSRLVASTHRNDAVTVESQPAAETARACDSFFEELQSDEAADATQRTDSVGTDSHDEESTDRLLQSAVVRLRLPIASVKVAVQTYRRNLCGGRVNPTAAFHLISLLIAGLAARDHVSEKPRSLNPLPEVP